MKEISHYFGPDEGETNSVRLPRNFLDAFPSTDEIQRAEDLLGLEPTADGHRWNTTDFDPEFPYSGELQYYDL